MAPKGSKEAQRAISAGLRCFSKGFNEEELAEPSLSKKNEGPQSSPQDHNGVRRAPMEPSGSKWNHFELLGNKIQRGVP